jgi:hypothetical protein
MARVAALAALLIVSIFESKAYQIGVGQDVQYNEAKVVV